MGRLFCNSYISRLPANKQSTSDFIANWPSNFFFLILGLSRLYLAPHLPISETTLPEEGGLH